MTPTDVVDFLKKAQVDMRLKVLPEKYFKNRLIEANLRPANEAMTDYLINAKLIIKGEVQRNLTIHADLVDEVLNSMDLIKYLE